MGALQSKQGKSPTSTPDLSICILGTGAGTTAIIHREPSSSFVVLIQGKPVLLADMGFGTVSSYKQQLPKEERLPEAIYISHNHTDHAGELPTMLHAEEKKGRTYRVLAHKDVMKRLQGYRLAELLSTGQPVQDFARFEPLAGNDDDGDDEHDEGHREAAVDTPEQAQAVLHHQVDEGGSLTMSLVRSQHSELCYGAVFYFKGQPVLGWSADSGYFKQLYDQLSIAPVLLLDARAEGNKEHASFEEIGSLAQQLIQQGKRVYITGYGCKAEAPQHSDKALGGAAPVHVGQHITLV